MKKLSLLLFVLLVFSIVVKAKDIQGTIIYDDREVDVTFKIPVTLITREVKFEKIQFKVKYYDEAGEKVVLKPHEAKEIRFHYKDEDVRMLTRDNSMGLSAFFSHPSKIFMKLEKDGYLKLFRIYTQSHSPAYYGGGTGVMIGGGYSHEVESLVLQKGDGEMLKPRGLFFRSDMTDYLDRCPSLVEKIENKEFRKRDLEQIVEYFNNYCPY